MIEIRNQEQTYKKPGIGTIIGGVMAGGAVGSLGVELHSSAADKIFAKIGTISKSLSEDELTTVENAITDTLQRTGLKEKGVSIFEATAENQNELSKIITSDIDKITLSKYLPKIIKDELCEKISKSVEKGGNAFYLHKSNTIIAPKNALSLALFHEMGHAANRNLSFISKAIQKCRLAQKLGIPIATIGLWKTKKAPNEAPKTKVDKTTTFIKENAGKLTFATFIPIIVEEALATIKGNNLAKSALSPELAKKVAKTNALGLSTYILGATISSLGIYLGVKLKDTIAKPKLVEAEDKKTQLKK